MLMTADSPINSWKMSQAVFTLGWGGAGADVDTASVGSDSVEEVLPSFLPPCKLNQGV